jgi:hypothetical protein
MHGSFMGSSLVVQKSGLSQGVFEDDLEREVLTETPSTSELDIEIDCPRCSGIMELHCIFDELAYFCENCSFELKAV